MEGFVKPNFMITWEDSSTVLASLIYVRLEGCSYGGFQLTLWASMMNIGSKPVHFVFIYILVFTLLHFPLNFILPTVFLQMIQNLRFLISLLGWVNLTSSFRVIVRDLRFQNHIHLLSPLQLNWKANECSENWLGYPMTFYCCSFLF